MHEQPALADKHVLVLDWMPHIPQVSVHVVFVQVDQVPPGVHMLEVVVGTVVEEMHRFDDGGSINAGG